jgi:MFS family permease
MFGLFLVGWGLSFIWGPISDKFGRTKSLAATILVYAVFTGAAAFSTNVWMLAVFRFLAGIGVGGEWAMAGTYVAEAWPEDRRKMGAGYLQTGYYFGFFVAAALNYTIGASLGWRAMFLCGLFPVVVSIATLLGVKEPLACCVPHKRPIRRKLICAWRGPGSSTSTPSSTRRIGRS